MQIFSGSENAMMGDSLLSPFARYVVPDSAANALRNLFNAHSFKHSLSHFNSFEKRYGGQDLTGKRVVMTRSDAFGDVLMATAIPAFLKWKYPECRVDVFCSKMVEPLWRDCGARVYATPLLFETATAYNHHILLEHVYEENSIAEQINSYDAIYDSLGIPHETVPDEFKRPFIVENPKDSEELDAFKINSTEGRHVVVQWASANRNRQYPPELNGALIDKLVSTYDDLKVYVVGSPANDFEVNTFKTKGHPRVVNMLGATKNFRSVIPLVKNAKAVVCPDSSILHLAAAFSTPTISIWGIFHPDMRAKYYPKHYPIFEKSVCPYAPCLTHDFHLPVENCREASNAITGKKPDYCNVIRAATPDLIMEKLKLIFDAY